MSDGPKPIETVYNGYRFRSRLEARWAVFFDALNIPYEYEKEGFGLGGGVWYLPDFWLPTEHCWVEVKPEHSAPQDWEKAALFAEQITDRYTLAYQAYAAHREPPNPLAARLHAACQALEEWTQALDVEFQGVEDPSPALREQQPIIHRLCLDVWERAQSLYDISERVNGAPPDSPSVYLCEGQPFVNAGVPAYRMILLGLGGTSDPEWWMTWGDGSEVALRVGGRLARFDHPRLRAAYAAARSARFEHGEHGGR